MHTLFHFVGSAKEETSTPSGGAEYLDRRTGTVSSVNAIITKCINRQCRWLSLHDDVCVALH